MVSTVNKLYLKAAVIIITELYTHRRLCMAGFKTSGDFKAYLIENRDKITLENHEGDNKWLVDDLMVLRNNFTGESIDEMINSPRPFADKHVAITAYVYDEFLTLLADRFLRKYNIADNYTEQERKQLQFIQQGILAEITYHSSSKAGIRNLCKYYGVQSMDEIRAKEGRTKEEARRDKDNAASNLLLEQFKEKHLVTLTDHPVWRETYLSLKTLTDPDDRARGIDFVRFGFPDVTEAEYERILAQSEQIRAPQKKSKWSTRRS